jgi:hypothetical protein
MLLAERQQKEITEQIRPMMEIPTCDPAADVIQVHHPKERGEDYKSRDKLDASSTLSKWNQETDRLEHRELESGQSDSS